MDRSSWLDMGIVRGMVGDAVVAFLWIFCASSLGVATSVMESAVPVLQGVALSLLTTTVLIFVLFLPFFSLCLLPGGPRFNPTGALAFYAAGAGAGDDTLLSVALRFPAQAAGAVGGVLAIQEVMPQQYKHMLGGPSLKVDMHTGAAAEGVLTFFSTLACLTINLKAPGRGIVVKTFAVAVISVVLIVAGAAYTGPSLSPINAFGWAYVDNGHNTWEHFYVYWISPIVGSLLAAWCFRLIFVQPVAKGKKA